MGVLAVEWCWGYVRILLAGAMLVPGDIVKWMLTVLDHYTDDGQQCTHW